MSEESITVTAIRDIISNHEEMGYDAPFTMFTWNQWLHMQAQMMNCFARYQRAIDLRQSQLALLVVLEMQEIMTEMYKEACTWIGSQEREQ